MIRISSRILILAGGCLAGYLLAPNPVGDGNAEVTVSEDSPRREAPPADGGLRSPSANPSTCEPETGAALRQDDKSLLPTLSALPETGLPQKYHKVVKPRSREPRTFPEWYSAFLNEARDDAWATPVEASISELIAVSGTPGIHAEYVACGTSRCIVAGYVDPTVGFDSCSIGTWIGRTRIFRRSFGLTCRDEEIAGLQRFIVFIEERPL